MSQETKTYKHPATSSGLVAGTRLRRGQHFTFDVSAEKMPEGGRSTEIMVADFRPTDEVDYCNPDQRH